jgi:hypothetical protein
MIFGSFFFEASTCYSPAKPRLEDHTRVKFLRPLIKHIHSYLLYVQPVSTHNLYTHHVTVTRYPLYHPNCDFTVYLCHGVGITFKSLFLELILSSVESPG